MSQAILVQGTLIQRGNGATPEVFTTIGEIIDFDGPGGESTEIPTTHVLSAAQEFRIGLRDEGTFNLTVNFLPGDAGQLGLQADRASAVIRNFRVTYTDAGAAKDSFSAYVKGFRKKGSRDGVVSATVTLRISGVVVQS
jgi:hypothetical protein